MNNGTRLKKIVTNTQLLIKALNHCAEAAEKSNTYIAIDPVEVVYALISERKNDECTTATIVLRNGMRIICDNCKIASTVSIATINDCV